jgi:hypothetical protein
MQQVFSLDMQQEFLWAAIALLAAAALAWWFLRRAQGVDPRIERQFNTVFSMISKQGKQDLIERWMIKKKCSRGHAMRLALEDWRSDRANR